MNKNHEEELNALKAEVETLNKKPAELNDDEMKQVSGGWSHQEIEIFLSESENGEGEKKGDNVAVFPGLPAFP